MVVSVEGIGVSHTGAATSADLGGSSIHNSTGGLLDSNPSRTLLEGRVPRQLYLDGG